MSSYFHAHPLIPLSRDLARRPRQHIAAGSPVESFSTYTRPEKLPTNSKKTKLRRLELEELQVRRLADYNLLGRVHYHSVGPRVSQNSNNFSNFLQSCTLVSFSHYKGRSTGENSTAGSTPAHSSAAKCTKAQMSSTAATTAAYRLSASYIAGRINIANSSSDSDEEIAHSLGDVKSPRGQRQSVIALEEKSLVSRTPWKTANRGGSLELSEAKALYDDAAQETRPPSPRVKPPLKIDDVIQGITTSSPSVKNPLEVDDAVQAISPPSPSVQIPLAVGLWESQKEFFSGRAGSLNQEFDGINHSLGARARIMSSESDSSYHTPTGYLSPLLTKSIAPPSRGPRGGKVAQTASRMMEQINQQYQLPRQPNEPDEQSGIDKVTDSKRMDLESQRLLSVSSVSRVSSANDAEYTWDGNLGSGVERSSRAGESVIMLRSNNAATPLHLNSTGSFNFSNVYKDMPRSSPRPDYLGPLPTHPQGKSPRAARLEVQSSSDKKGALPSCPGEREGAPREDGTELKFERWNEVGFERPRPKFEINKKDTSKGKTEKALLQVFDGQKSLWHDIEVEIRLEKPIIDPSSNILRGQYAQCDVTALTFEKVSPLRGLPVLQKLTAACAPKYGVLTTTDGNLSRHFLQRSSLFWTASHFANVLNDRVKPVVPMEFPLSTTILLDKDSEVKRVGLVYQLPMERDGLSNVQSLESAEESRYLAQAFQLLTLIESNGEIVSEVPHYSGHGYWEQARMHSTDKCFGDDDLGLAAVHFHLSSLGLSGEGFSQDSDTQVIRELSALTLIETEVMGSRSDVYASQKRLRKEDVILPKEIEGEESGGNCDSKTERNLDRTEDNRPNAATSVPTETLSELSGSVVSGSTRSEEAGEDAGRQIEVLSSSALGRPKSPAPFATTPSYVRAASPSLQEKARLLSLSILDDRDDDSKKRGITSATSKLGYSRHGARLVGEG